MSSDNRAIPIFAEGPHKSPHSEDPLEIPLGSLVAMAESLARARQGDGKMTKAKHTCTILEKRFYGP